MDVFLIDVLVGGQVCSSEVVNAQATGGRRTNGRSSRWRMSYSQGRDHELSMINPKRNDSQRRDAKLDVVLMLPRLSPTAAIQAALLPGKSAAPPPHHHQNRFPLLPCLDLPRNT